MKKFGVLLENVGASQISFFVISELNKYIESDCELEPFVFYEDIQKNCLPANFSVMEIQESWCFEGAIIATSISTAKKMLGFPKTVKRFFYVWDVEWIRNSTAKSKYEEYSKVYTDKSISLIARSDSHKKLIETAFNRKVDSVVSDFNASEILTAIGQNTGEEK